MKKLSNRIVTVNRTPLFFGKDAFTAVDRLVKTLRPHRIFILTDKNTCQFCLPRLMEATDSVHGATILMIDPGESSKNIAQAISLWNQLLEAGAERSDLLINLGGGVVTDLGGFIAASFQRGIRYINIPTSLIGMADAAIGGKTAINLGNIKNQVGFFYPASAICVVPDLLETLPLNHLRAGFAEVVKSALIGDAALWRSIRRTEPDHLVSMPVTSTLWNEFILNTISIKNAIVAKDFHEKKLRKSLNFGHTIGHALEGLMTYPNGDRLLHGEAVAAGMIGACYLSNRKAGLSTEDMEQIVHFIRKSFQAIPLGSEALSGLLELMQRDKKRVAGKVSFVLISKPGKPVVNVACTEKEITEAIQFINTQFLLPG